MVGSHSVPGDVRSDTPSFGAGSLSEVDILTSEVLVKRMGLISDELGNQDLSEAVNKEDADLLVDYYHDDCILMRKVRPASSPPNEELWVLTQMVVPKCHKAEILTLAHYLFWEEK